MPLAITIDRSVCMGSGTCSYYAPGVFDLDEEGIAVVVDAVARPEDEIVLAANGCPTHAITLSRDGERIA